MMQTITQATIEATKAVIMAVKGAEIPVSNARPIQATL